jgi:hypothetical protein
VHYADLWGLREGKYQALLESYIAVTSWVELNPGSPFYLFIPRDEAQIDEYEKGWKVTDIFPENVLGFQTHRDNFAVAFDEEVMRLRIADLRSKDCTDNEIIEKYGLSDVASWKLSLARKNIRDDCNWEQYIVKCLYRPFDLRYCYFNVNVMDRPRPQLVKHVYKKENLCILDPAFGEA